MGLMRLVNNLKGDSMTRDTVKVFFMQIEEAPEPSNRWQPEIVCEMIDQIFNDLESRTCERCKYGHKEHDTKIMCQESFHITDDYGDELHSFVWVDNKFGCNKWEAQ